MILHITRLLLQFGVAKMPLEPASSSLGELPSLQYDQDARSHFKIEIPPNKYLDLQFPPKITTDSKQANWQEDHRFGYEEYAKWMGALARKINVELNYVMWGTWDQTRISDQVRKIKQHLYVSGIGVEDKVPFIFISGWKIVEATGKLPAFRLMDVAIEYSREYIGSGNNYWPLHTKINLQCKLFTLSGSRPQNPKTDEINFSSGRLPADVPIAWA